ncbi:hypothetical protein D3C76_1329160 [compost metagenome]
MTLGLLQDATKIKKAGDPRLNALFTFRYVCEGSASNLEDVEVWECGRKRGNVGPEHIRRAAEKRNKVVCYHKE